MPGPCELAPARCFLKFSAVPRCYLASRFQAFMLLLRCAGAFQLEILCTARVFWHTTLPILPWNPGGDLALNPSRRLTHSLPSLYPNHPFNSTQQRGAASLGLLRRQARTALASSQSLEFNCPSRPASDCNQSGRPASSRPPLRAIKAAIGRAGWPASPPPGWPTAGRNACRQSCMRCSSRPGGAHWPCQPPSTT